MNVIIVGAGIGGLTLALMLNQKGIDCDIFESVREIKPLGVGINLLPHAVTELEHLGLLEALAATAVPTSALHYYNQYGQLIWQEPRGLDAGYAVPQLSIHRGELQLLLAKTVSQRLGGNRLHTGMAFESLTQDAQGVTAVFRNRNDQSVQEVRGDILIGADGIHSSVRRFFHPQHDELRFSGRMLWRAVTESTPYLDGKTMFMAGHQDQKFVCYPISEQSRQQGRSLINWIAELRVPSAELPTTDWNRKVDASIFADRFASWRWDWIDVPAIIGDAQAIYEFPLVDKDPLPRWTQGRAALLGDAAHPMYPIGSNGSAQAILDARYLTERIQTASPQKTGSIELALKEYEAERLPITAGIVLRNRLNGPEQVMQIAHERAPNGFAHIHDAVSQAELTEVASRYKRLAGFDPARLQEGRKQ
ncbi:flavin-dependent oxidoreductase [Pollutimonas subterranea]|uniref:Flavin-dependent oxidoreductase n=1 Tax=Pollutimonas subterranea TaxID=2045210 RepID=A0A2N4U0X6_9BURK|nr:flavin-dependent oxidoreductase [Pollutimonas subterranea]PLC48674.1 flavin-dependent oxidoreductase [Pollutimonas subterranea]